MTRNEVFVGRAQQLEELLDQWRAAVDGAGRLVLVSGDAGIGKTHLVEHLVADIGAIGVVAWGACSGPGSPPLWPWRAVLHDLGIDSGVGRRDTDIGDLADPAGGQVNRHEELVERLRSAATESGPILVVLDDLHWADDASADILRLVAAQVRRLPVLVVATLRTSEVRAESVLHATLTDLAPSTVSIHLDGLAVDAVTSLVQLLTGRQPALESARALRDRTAGNPFFLRELLRLVVAEGDLEAAMSGVELPVPQRVRDVLLRRLDQLSPAARHALDVAAVVGREAPFPVVAAVLDTQPPDIAAAVDEAEAARLVSVDDGRVRLAHDLVREALVQALDPARRRTLHLAIAHALRDRAGRGAAVGEIADHLVDALPLGVPTEAAAAALAAGRAALAEHAPGDAIRHLERGLAAVPTEPLDVRGALLVALGEARTIAGDRSGAREAYLAAADTARLAGDIDQLAVSALGFAGMMGTPRTDPAQVELLEEAFAAAGDRLDALAIRVRARLAHALVFSQDRARRLRLAEEALTLARDLGDRQALATTLYVWNIVHATSANYEERLARADELLALGRASGDREAEAWALHFHAHHMAEGGDFGAFDADVAACEAFARQTNNSTWQWTALVHRAMRATMQGRFEEAEELGNRGFEIGARSEHEVAVATFGSHLIGLRTWQGRLDELLPMITSSAGQYPEVPAVWTSLPFAHAELGQLAEAAEELHRVMATRALEDIPGAQSWTVAVAMLVRAAALTGEVDLARRVRPLLEPFRDRHIVGPFADLYLGPAALYIGLCAATMGHLEEAASELERALRSAEAVGARPVVAWTKSELADVLERGAGDARRIAELRSEAAAELAALGMPRHVDRVGPVAASAGPNVFRRDGGAWTITYAGRTVEVRHTKGLADLHRLLDAPGVELHVLELAQEGGDPDGVPTRRSARQPILDERAKSEYRRRVLALQAEVEDAKACADLARAEVAEIEHDLVVSELAAALGFGGRDRSMTDEAERARQAVRARIRYVLDRLGRVHPELRRHLDRAVVTGTFCAYQPEQATDWETR